MPVAANALPREARCTRHASLTPCFRCCYRSRARGWVRLRLLVLLAQFQSANVGDDGPTILHRNLYRIRGHGAPTIGDRIKEVAHRRLAQTIIIEGGGPPETASHNHAVAIS